MDTLLSIQQDNTDTYYYFGYITNRFFTKELNNALQRGIAPIPRIGTVVIPEILRIGRGRAA